MTFEKELCELINKLPNEKVKIIFLEKVLNQEKNKKRRRIITKLLSNAKKELESKRKRSIKKEDDVKLEEIVRPGTAPMPETSPITEIEKDYLHPSKTDSPLTQKRTEPNLEEDYLKKSDYKQKGLETETAYVPEHESEYISKLEGEMSFKAREESTAFNPCEVRQDYTPVKESEEYKRQEQFKQMVEESIKENERLEEYRRKKRLG